MCVPTHGGHMYRNVRDLGPIPTSQAPQNTLSMPFTVFQYEPLLPRYDGRRPLHFLVLSWTWHGKLGGVRLLQFFDRSLRCQDTTEDDLSIFRVRSWTRHGKIGGVRFLRFFDTSLRCRDIVHPPSPSRGARGSRRRPNLT